MHPPAEHESLAGRHRVGHLQIANGQIGCARAAEPAIVHGHAPACGLGSHGVGITSRPVPVAQYQQSACIIRRNQAQRRLHPIGEPRMLLIARCLEGIHTLHSGRQVVYYAIAEAHHGKPIALAHFRMQCLDDFQLLILTVVGHGLATINHHHHVAVAIRQTQCRLRHGQDKQPQCDATHDVQRAGWQLPCVQARPQWHEQQQPDGREQDHTRPPCLLMQKRCPTVTTSASRMR